MTPRWLEFFGNGPDVQLLNIDDVEDWCSDVVVVRGSSASRVLGALGVESPSSCLRFAVYLDRGDPFLLVADAAPNEPVFRSAMYWIAGMGLPVHVTVDICRLRNQGVRLTPIAV